MESRLQYIYDHWLDCDRDTMRTIYDIVQRGQLLPIFSQGIPGTLGHTTRYSTKVDFSYRYRMAVMTDEDLLQGVVSGWINLSDRAAWHIYYLVNRAFLKKQEWLP